MIASMLEKARRLKTIAKWINENSKKYKAEIVEGYCNTDRKIGRLRSPGQGRYGNKIVIRNRETNEIVKEHNAAETYRQNWEVEDWVRWNITDPDAINSEYSKGGN